MSRFAEVRSDLQERPRTWLVTGAAGFIGSHLVERLLAMGQRVRGLDDFSTGHRANLDDVHRRVGEEAWQRFGFTEARLPNSAACRKACDGADIVLHQAALGSVPRSISDPLASHEANVNGSLGLLKTCVDAGVGRFVYASSSSVYGDHPGLPKREPEIGDPLSPYAATKRINEIYATVFGKTYGIETVGLRYFNVFGPRQDPNGPYAAVIPRWIQALLRSEPVVINGDGETSRDFCPVDNVVAANILAGTASADATGAAYNVAVGDRTTLNDLFAALCDGLVARERIAAHTTAEHADFRPGDVRHSLADLASIRDRLGYEPLRDFTAGLGPTLDWFIEQEDRAATP